MAKEESIGRINLIIKKLRSGNASFKEICDYLRKESALLEDTDFTISKRTFQRDIDLIRNLYKIDIEYNRHAGAYSITFDNHSELNQRMFEAYDTFNALNVAERLPNHIIS